MCVDYRDMNRASPKDDFPLPHIDTLVDNTATSLLYSLLYSFIHHSMGHIFSFGLKNVGQLIRGQW